MRCMPITSFGLIWSSRLEVRLGHFPFRAILGHGRQAADDLRVQGLLAVAR